MRRSTTLLRSVRRRTKPTTVNLYEVFRAVLYLLRIGCQWRFLSSEFPFKIMPQRRVVERSFAWLEKEGRRLWKNCERLLNTSLQFIHLAFSALLLRKRS